MPRKLPWNLAKVGHVIVFEYTKHVFTRRFLFSMLALPAIIAVIAVVGTLVARMETNTDPVGYVDRAQVLQTVSPDRLPPVDADDAVALIAYADEAAAKAALDSETIQGYYVVAEDYATSGRVRLVYADRSPTGVAQRTFRDFLQANLVRDLPVDVARRLTAGADFVLPKADGGRQPMDFSLFINAFMPAILGFGFILSIFTTSGYLMQAVVEEKENRTMEVLITSISSGQLIAGKILGISLVGLTQVGGWALMVAGGLLWGRTRFEWLGNIQISGEMVWVLALVMLPAYLMFGSFMVAIGATVAEASEGQQITGFLTLPAMMPFWFVAVFLQNPNSPLAVGLSLFPLTAPVAISIRAGTGTLPGWQLALASAILMISAAGAMWLAGRAFGMGQLLYGQRLPWRRLLGLQREGAAS